MADSSSVFATVTPNGLNVSEFINNRENQDFRYRAEQREVDELARRAKAQQDAKLAAQEKRFLDMKGATPSGINSVDVAQRMWMDQAMDKRLSLFQKEASGQRLTPQEQALYQKLDNTPETLALMAKSYQEEQQRYADLVKKGEIHRDLKYEADMQKLATSAIPFIDDDGNPVIGIDNDGDGKPDIVSFNPQEGISLKPKYTPKVDYGNTLLEFSKRLEPQVNTTDNNFVKTTVTGVPLAVAQQGAKSLIYGPDGGLSPLSISYFYEAGIDPQNVTDEQLTAFEQKTTQDIINSQKKGTESDTDWGNMLASRKEARALKKEQEEKAKIGNPVVPSRNTWGPQYSKIDTNTYRSVPVSGKVILPAIALNTKQNVTDATLENFTYANNGRLLIDVSYPINKVTTTTDNGETKSVSSSKERRKQQIEVSPETESRIAAALGISVQDLKSAATNPNAEKPKQSIPGF